MGLFDSVYIRCPKCGAPMEFQSKALADPYMRSYTLGTAPTAILSDIINSPQYHKECGQWVALIDRNFPPGWQAPRPSPVPTKVKNPENPRTHFQDFKWWPDDKTFSYDDLDE